MEYIENDIKVLLEYANNFYAELMELHTFKFEEQLDYIFSFLDKLVQCNLENIALVFGDDEAFIELKKNMQVLLEIHNQIKFNSHLAEYDQMKMIFDLYKFGSDIHLYTYRLLKMYSNEGEMSNV